MIRFSHEANSWQIHLAMGEWKNISVESARDYYDAGLDVANLIWPDLDM